MLPVAGGTAVVPRTVCRSEAAIRNTRTPTIQWSQAAPPSWVKPSAQGATNSQMPSSRLTHSCHARRRPIAEQATRKMMTPRTQAFQEAFDTAGGTIVPAGAPGGATAGALKLITQGEMKSQ